MTTLKKWWNKFTTKVTSAWDQFTKIIRDRLDKKNPETKWSKTLAVLTFVLTTAATWAFFYFVPILPAVIPFLITALPFYHWVSVLIGWVFVLIPAFSLVVNLFDKMFSFILTPWSTRDITPFKNLFVYYPLFLVTTLAGAAAAVVIVISQVGVFLMNAARKVIWLADIFVQLGFALVETRSIGAFKESMSAWFQSWTPTFFTEESLGDVTVKKFKMEQDEVPKKSKKMGPVTPATV